MKSRSVLSLALPLALLATACGSGGAGNFAGNYVGTWSVTTTVQGSSTTYSESRGVTVTASTEAGADLVINLQPSSETACALKATRNGDDANFIAGQTCLLASGSSGEQFTVTSGVASLYPADGGVGSGDGGVTGSRELIINLSGTVTDGTMTGVYDGFTR